MLTRQRLQWLATQSMAAVALRVAGAVLMLFNTYLVLRLLESEDDEGLAFSLISTVMVGSTLARLGLDNVLLRASAVGFLVAGQNIDKRRVMRTGFFLSAFAALLVLIAVLAGLPWISREEFTGYRYASLAIFAVAIPGLAMQVLLAFSLRGLGRTFDSVLCQAITQPLLFTALLGIGAALARSGLLEIGLAYSGSCILSAFIAATVLAIRSANDQPKQATTATVSTQALTTTLLSNSLPLMVVAAMQILTRWGPAIYLLALAEPGSVVNYHLCARITIVTDFLLFGLTAVVAPMMANLYETKQYRDLSRVYYLTCLAGLLAGGAPLLLLFAFAPNVLSILGPGYEEAATTLRLLVPGQIATVATGSVATLLVMMSANKSIRNCALVGGLMSAGLCLIAIPRFGAEGAAAATSIALVSSNLLAFTAYLRRLAECRHKFEQLGYQKPPSSSEAIRLEGAT